MPSTAKQLDRRVAALEREVRALRSQLKIPQKKQVEPWWDRLAGKFENDPLFDETVKAGRTYRRSLAGRKR